MITGLILWNKIMKRKRLDQRDQRMETNFNRMESKIDAIMKAGGVEWNAVISEASECSVRNAKRLSRWLGPIPFFARFAGNIIPLRRKQTMKEYLKKLGKTKFQTYLVVTITNLLILIGYLTGHVKVEGQLNDWMPAINLVVQLIAGMVYQWVEGSIDRAGVTQSDPNKFIQG